VRVYFRVDREYTRDYTRNNPVIKEVVTLKDIDFAITVNMTLSLDGGTASVSVKNVDLKPAMISLPMRDIRTQADEQKTYHQIVFEVAQKTVVETGKDVFTAADLYNRARQKYPHIKRSTFNNRVMAAAPKHPSYKHLSGKKDFLEFLGEGKYKLKGGK
jgi:hypothetical protein